MSSFPDHLPQPALESDEDVASLRSPTVAPGLSSPRKRRRLVSSTHALTSQKRVKRSDRRPPKNYKDEYRILYNETVRHIAARFIREDSSRYYPAQIGTVFWSAEEKEIFFSALERLGKDDLPGIAKAIGSKSIPEIRAFLILLQDAAKERQIAHDSSRKRSIVTDMDIPAALEVSPEFEHRLDMAGEALAWFQEGFEARQEKDQYGDYWLITPDVANDIRKAMNDHAEAQILQEIPEATLLIPDTLLELSRNIFMNFSPAMPTPWPHWSEVDSDFATEPSIYRTAFKDFHALVVSLTRRLVQAIIIQTMSRIRAQGWRKHKGVAHQVRPRDVLTTVDILGLKRNAKNYWRHLPRRCGLIVFEAASDKEVPWDEIEEMFCPNELDVDEEAANSDPISYTEEFSLRAGRSGTPLPKAQSTFSEDLETNDTNADDGDDYPPSDEYSETSNLDDELAELLWDSSEDEAAKVQATEAFDQEASRNEEHHLLGIFGNSAAPGHSPKENEYGARSRNTESRSRKIRSKSSHKRVESPSRREYGTALESADWRSWTQYRAVWEEHETPVPLAAFRANEKKHSSPRGPQVTRDASPIDSADESRHGELPIRSTREFAAMQGRMYGSAYQGSESGQEDNAELPALSIEIGDLATTHAVEMQDKPGDGPGYHSEKDQDTRTCRVDAGTSYDSRKAGYYAEEDEEAHGREVHYGMDDDTESEGYRPENDGDDMDWD
jgi:RNA polymerase I-specific transcription initiation factor RRN5